MFQAADIDGAALGVAFRLEDIGREKERQFLSNSTLSIFNKVLANRRLMMAREHS